MSTYFYSTKKILRSKIKYIFHFVRKKTRAQGPTNPRDIKCEP